MIGQDGVYSANEWPQGGVLNMISVLCRLTTLGSELFPSPKGFLNRISLLFYSMYLKKVSIGKKIKGSGQKISSTKIFSDYFLFPKCKEMHNFYGLESSKSLKRICRH